MMVFDKIRRECTQEAEGSGFRKHLVGPERAQGIANPFFLRYAKRGQQTQNDEKSKKLSLFL